MEVLIRVICSGNGSLREAIVNDKKLENHSLYVSRHRTAGRNPGWAKIHSYDLFGVLNINWDGSTKTLVCRVITKSPNKPDAIIGNFIAYLLTRHRKRIKTIIF
jgi:hypothetical protein